MGDSICRPIYPGRQPFLQWGDSGLEYGFKADSDNSAIFRNISVTQLCISPFYPI